MQVDVREPPSGRMHLVVLEHGVANLAVAVPEDDVEDRVHAVVTGQRAAKLALGDGEGVRVAAVPVDDPRDEAARAQPPGLGAAEPLARLHVELDPLTGHDGPV